jgi:hypothetical protein
MVATIERGRLMDDRQASLARARAMRNDPERARSYAPGETVPRIGGIELADVPGDSELDLEAEVTKLERTALKLSAEFRTKQLREQEGDDDNLGH